jgi:hypothetical protein
MFALVLAIIILQSTDAPLLFILSISLIVSTEHHLQSSSLWCRKLPLGRNICPSVIQTSPLDLLPSANPSTQHLTQYAFVPYYNCSKSNPSSDTSTHSRGSPSHSSAHQRRINEPPSPVERFPRSIDLQQRKQEEAPQRESYGWACHVASRPYTRSPTSQACVWYFISFQSHHGRPNPPPRRL